MNNKYYFFAKLSKTCFRKKCKLLIGMIFSPQFKLKLKKKIKTIIDNNFSVPVRRKYKTTLWIYISYCLNENEMIFAYLIILFDNLTENKKAYNLMPLELLKM